MSRVFQRGTVWYADFRGHDGKRVRRKIEDASNEEWATEALRTLKVEERQIARSLAQGSPDPRLTNHVAVGPLLEAYLLHQTRIQRFGTVVASRIALADTVGYFVVTAPAADGRMQQAPNRNGPKEGSPLLWPPRREQPLDAIEATPRKFIRGPLGADMVDEITAEPKVEEWVAERKAKGYAPRTLDIRLRCLKAFLNWARKTRRIAANPIAEAKFGIHVPKGRWRALKPAEVEDLLAASPEPYRTIWLALVCTGMRRGESTNLRWPDVSLTSRPPQIRVRAETSKSARQRLVEITQPLRERLEVLASQAADRRGHVFLNADGRPWANNLDKRFRACAQRAGLLSRLEYQPAGHRRWLVYRDGEGGIVREELPAGTTRAQAQEIRRERCGYDDGCVVIHSLRHTFATELLRAGEAPKVVSELLGHSTIQMTLNTYAHVFPEDRQSAIGKLTFGRGGTNVAQGAATPGGTPQIHYATGT